MSIEDGSTEWMNPPPPGTSDDNPIISKEKYSSNDTKKDVRSYSKSPKESNNDKYPYRSRSRSRDRYSKHSRDKRRRSRSRECRYRSRSGSRKRYSERKYSQRSYKNKYSRSRSRSRSRHHRKSYSKSRSPSIRRRSTHSRSYSSSSISDRESYSRHRRIKRDYNEKLHNKRFEETEEDDDESEQVQENTFKNDGSFLEMFKKLQEAQAKTEIKIEEPEAGTSEVKKLPISGKRRGGRVLKTGVVQKLKNPNELDEEPKDAWSVYMKEVRKYKEACCDDDSKTRPLVK